MKWLLYVWICCSTAHESFFFVLSAWMLYFEERKCSLMLGVFLGVNLLHSCLRLWKENLNIQRGCSARRRNIPQGCRRKTGSSRRLVMYWPQCKSISVILLMTWSMIYTVSGACFLPPPLAKCWQCLCIQQTFYVIVSKLICAIHLKFLIRSGCQLITWVTA